MPACTGLCAGRGLARRARLDRQRVDGMLHQIAQRLVHQAMPRDGPLANERARDDREAPVRPAALDIAGVPAVALAFVLERDRFRLEGGQAFADLLFDAQGLLSGSSTYL
jgi:hypothetical protein